MTRVSDAVGHHPPLTVGLSTPWDLWACSAGDRRARLNAVVEAGVDHLFCADHVSFRGGNGSDAIVEMAAVHGIEPRLGLYIGVLLLSLRHPMIVARQITTLAQVAPGQLTVGVGVGGEDRHEFEVCEVDPATRGRRTDVAIELVRRLLDGETVDGDGTFFNFRHGVIRPTPVPRVRFTAGGRSDAAIRRAGRVADGWLAAWCSPRRFAEGVAAAEAEGVAAGRSGAVWQHGLQVWVGVGDDPVDGRRRVAGAMERFYGIPFEPFERYTPCGTAEQIAEFLAPYVEAGATTLNLTPVGADRDVELAAIAEVKRLLLAR